MLNFIRKNRLALLLSFMLPLFIVALAYLANGIYWGSQTSVLAGDAYHQYVGAHALFSRLLHQGGGLLYTWTSGLGLNLYAFSSYYMGSFFLVISYFFDAKTMPDALYLITLLKFGAIGLSAFVSFSHIYRKVNRWLVLALALSYSLMSFLTSQIEIIMWLDVFIWLPLIIWGLHRILAGEGRWLYFVSLVILFIQNYYFGFMIAIFVGLYFLVRFLGAGWSWRVLADFLITSALAAVSSLIMLLPMYLDLKANGQDFSAITGLLTEKSWALDVFAKSFVGSYDTTQFGAVPMIYAGLLPLILAVGFFLVRGISWRLKAGMFVLLGVLVASFYFKWLDLAWQGFHSPNMFLHRYSFLFSLLIVILALEFLEHEAAGEFRFWPVLAGAIFLSAAFTAVIVSQHYAYVKSYLAVLTGLLMFAFLILFFGRARAYLSSRFFALIVILFSCVDLGVNTYYQISGVQKEWAFASRTYYEEQRKKLSLAAESINSDSGGRLARTDNTAPDTANDGMKYGFNTISQFSSVRNSNSGAVMNELGFQTDGLYLNLRYPGNTLLMDSIFGVQYNINDYQPSKYGFTGLVDGPSDVTKNSYAQSLGIFVPGKYKDANMAAGNALVSQTNFVNALAGSEQQYFRQIYSFSEKATGRVQSFASGGTVSISRDKTKNEPISVKYQLKIPAGAQAYIKVPDVSYGNKKAETMQITADKTRYSMPTNNTGQFFNLGYYADETTIDVSLSWPDNDYVSFSATSFWILDVPTYSRTMAKLSANKVTAKEIKNGAALSYDADSDGQLFLTVPYDKGWSATLDGKPVELLRAQSGFMKVDAPSGEHRLVLKFFPNGLKAGMAAFAGGILLFAAYDWLRKRKKH
ncbi:YfhO family protein [Lactovum odontotermitis]